VSCLVVEVCLKGRRGAVNVMVLTGRQMMHAKGVQMRLF
jgi:hypothetical protein